jgi:hypothetical protein
MDLWKEELYLLEKNKELYFHFIGKIAAIIHCSNRATLIFSDGYTLGGKYKEGISKEIKIPGTMKYYTLHEIILLPLISQP